MENSAKFQDITKQLLTLTNQRVNDKSSINMCLTKLNDLKYFCSIRDNDVAMLLVNRLCMIIQASDSELIKNYCHFIINLTQCGTIMSGRTYSTCKKWILQGLEFATPESHKPILLALKNIIEIGPPDVICQVCIYSINYYF